MESYLESERCRVAGRPLKLIFAFIDGSESRDERRLPVLDVRTGTRVVLSGCECLPTVPQIRRLGNVSEFSSPSELICSNELAAPLAILSCESSKI